MMSRVVEYRLWVFGALLTGCLNSAIGQTSWSHSLPPPPIPFYTVVPDRPLEFSFPHLLEPSRPTRLAWEGWTFVFGNPLEVGVTMKFDWTDPTTGNVVYSEPYNLPPNVASAFVELLIPYSPSRVSIHFETQDPRGYSLKGVFTHEVIPEPAEYALVAGLGVLAYGLARQGGRPRGGSPDLRGNSPPG